MSARLVADRDGRYVEANDAALALFGVSLEALCKARIGAFSGPHADLALNVWRRLASTGAQMPVGESTVYRPDGSEVRVRYTRIAPRPDGCYDIEVEAVGDAGVGTQAPPVADRPSDVLREWRAAERAAERDAAAGRGADAISGTDALRELYHHSISGKQRDAGRKDDS